MEHIVNLAHSFVCWSIQAFGRVDVSQVTAMAACNLQQPILSQGLYGTVIVKADTAYF